MGEVLLQFTQLNYKNIIALVHGQDVADDITLKVLAVSLVQENELEKLYFLLRKAISLVPNSSTRCFIQGLFQQAKKDHERAREMFGRAIKKNQNCPYSILALGNTYAEKSETETAMVHFRQCLKNFSNFPMVHLTIGIEFLRTNCPKNAYLALKEAYSLSDSNPVVLNELGVISFYEQKY